MFCTNCGKELKEDSCFCENCGTQMKKESAVSIEACKEKILNKIPKKYLGISVAMVVVLIFGIMFWVNRKIVIDLNDYVVVRFEGYDTVGRAIVEFDDEAFEEDYNDKIKCIKKNFLGRYTKPAKYIAEHYLSGSLDNLYSLSNGDEVVYHWECQEELVSEYFNCKLKCGDKKIKVNGLKEVVPFDPFADVTVTFNGISSNGIASIEVNSEDEVCQRLDYDIEPSEDLCNGDEVTVKVSRLFGEAVDEYCIKNYGKVPETLEKKYTVSGLGRYATSLEQISEDMIGSMKTMAEGELHATVNRYWSQHEKLEGMTYLGCYFLTSEDPDRTGNHNVMRLVYKVTASDSYPEENFHQNFEYYYDVMFEDLKVKEDGSSYGTITSPITSCNSFERNVEYDSVNGYADTYWYDGYATLEELENHFYLGFDYYTVETNMK